VGIHGFAHLHAWKKWPWQTIKDIQRGREALEGVVVSDNIKYLFRPPYGKLNLATLVYLWIERLPICYWTLDSKDTWSEDRRRKRKDWIKPLAKNGGVILLHDFDRRSDAESTLLYMTETVQTCVAIARQSKLKFCIMSELRQKTSPKTLKI
jgi:peptidoglycan/xylan/chitin deacetylase (PgdA/CDA1 family)